MLKADVASIQGVPGLARKAARSLQKPPQEVRGRCSRRYAKFCLGDSDLFEPKRRARTERDNDQ